MTKLALLPEAYRLALRAACGSALDANVSYQTAFEAFVLPRIADADPARNHFLGMFECASECSRRAWEADLRARIEGAPRGTWLVTRHHDHEGTRTWFRPLISDGTGSQVPCFDTYDSMPDFEAVHRRMAKYEIYRMRNFVEGERSRARNVALIAERGFRTGATFHNLRLGAKRYSTARIVEMHPVSDPKLKIIGPDDRGDGWLALSLTRRGSGKRYGVHLSAHALASAIDEADALRQAEKQRGSLPLFA